MYFICSKRLCRLNGTRQIATNHEPMMIDQITRFIRWASDNAR